MERTPTSETQLEIYSPPARRFHWWTVALILIQVPLGLYMAYRGNVLGIFDDLTNNLYSSHKLIGIIIFLVVLARLAYRLMHGAPADEPTLERWHKAASHFNHWGLYLLLLATADRRLHRHFAVSGAEHFRHSPARASWAPIRTPPAGHS